MGDQAVDDKRRCQWNGEHQQTLYERVVKHVVDASDIELRRFYKPGFYNVFDAHNALFTAESGSAFLYGANCSKTFVKSGLVYYIYNFG